eukprot:CAMPEP_0172039056 /NCGR_PEP_ID=MMETSP1041-20130122/23677_1 /TAXON_ID=464988 /ORGANISM="Hemiselmis andersenii, Strain CCMP439" /LENGTH=233 /DNA_ID=CAMNT_0012696693 /DNA_START=260 /DNA_END=961 /DNA_ORIENTATION=-
MSSNESLPLSCACGEVQGTLSGSGKGSYIVCYCTCCQDMHTFLGKESLMDAQGGCHFRMTAPGDIKFTKGESKVHHERGEIAHCRPNGGLAAIRVPPHSPRQINSFKLTEKTGTVRWYTDCCKSPIGATVSDLPPFMMDLSTSFIAAKDRALVARSLGPITMRMFADSSKKDTSALDNPKPSSRTFWLFTYMYHFLKFSIRWWWRGALSPHPFFVKGGKKLICEPAVVKAKIA